MSFLRRSPGPLAGLFLMLCLAAGATGQQPQLTPAEISRDLLYQPARLIEAAPSGMVLRAEQFTYRFATATNQWSVTREKNDAAAHADDPVESYRARNGQTYTFEGASSDNAGTLEISVSENGGTRTVTETLWDKQRLLAAWQAETAGHLTADDVDPAEPEVAGVAESADDLWLAIRHYTGEGYFGLGTIVRVSLRDPAVQVLQPAAIATSSVTKMVWFDGKLWFGTHKTGEAYLGPGVGLVRFEPATGQMKNYIPENSAINGRIITALHAETAALWVATDSGVCRVTLASGGEEAWACWQIQPVTTLAAPVPVSNAPGAAPRGQLAAGGYEVRWVNANFFLLATPDTIEGWVDAEEFAELRRRRFDADPYELDNTYGDGAAIVRLLDAPDGDPLRAPVVFRTVLEPVGEPDEKGMQRVRAHAGWIPRGALEVTQVIEPAAPRRVQ